MDLIEAMTCDEKDRHVLAAAVRANAEVLVTANLRDFPETSIKPFDLTVVSPDDFLLDQLDLYPGPVLNCLAQQVGRYESIHGPTSVSELCVPLSRAGVPKFAAEVRRNLRSPRG